MFYNHQIHLCPKCGGTHLEAEVTTRYLLERGNSGTDLIGPFDYYPRIINWIECRDCYHKAEPREFERYKEQPNTVIPDRDLPVPVGKSICADRVRDVQVLSRVFMLFLHNNCPSIINGMLEEEDLGRVLTEIMEQEHRESDETFWAYNRLFNVMIHLAPEGHWFGINAIRQCYGYWELPSRRSREVTTGESNES